MRRSFCVLAILFLCASLTSGTEQGLDSQRLSLFYDLWKDSAFGRDPNRTERAEWILQTDAATMGCRRWPTSGERNSEFWHGAMPEGTVAQAHTHTVMADPRPAPKDVELSKRTGIPVYTISGVGVWMVTPDGKVTRMADAKWYSTVDKSKARDCLAR